MARQPDLYGNPLCELYDLVQDPLEEHNIAQEQLQVAADMEAELEGWIADHLQALGQTEDPLTVHGVSLRRAANILD